MSLFSWLYRGNDLTTYFLPEAEYFADYFKRGIIPLWNPWIMGGYPYLSDPQNYLWYPPNYIFLILPAQVGFLLLLVAHLLFAGWMITKLLPRLPNWIRMVGALIFILSPKLIAHLEEGNWSLLIADTWLPFLLWSLRKKSVGLVALGLSAIMINNLNIGYYAAIFTSIYIGLNYRLLKTSLLTCLLALPRWLPLLFYGPQTARSEFVGQVLPFWSWTKIFKSFIVPLQQGHPQLQNEEILYLGIIPIALLVWKGLIPTLRRDQTFRELTREQKVWLGWAGFLVLVALNTKTVIFPALMQLPGFSLLRITTRPWIFMGLFIALVAPRVIYRIYRTRAWLSWLATGLILVEFFVFGVGLFSRRVVDVTTVPMRFYETMAASGAPVLAYCTTGCLDRLTAQRHGIALLGGNNPMQLRSFVEYLERAGGYHEPEYHPILPPYTTFSAKPQPNALLLGQTGTKFVVSPYQLTDPQLVMVDRTDDWLLYVNQAAIMPFSEHYFSVSLPGKNRAGS